MHVYNIYIYTYIHTYTHSSSLDASPLRAKAVRLADEHQRRGPEAPNQYHNTTNENKRNKRQIKQKKK